MCTLTFVFLLVWFAMQVHTEYQHHHSENDVRAWMGERWQELERRLDEIEARLPPT